MDTSTYFYAAYTVFWLLPAIYVIRLFRDFKSLEQKVAELQDKLGHTP